MPVYKITPVAKPRMTQQDKWLRPPRPAVAKYWAFKDQVRGLEMHLPIAYAHVTFHMPMPKSWPRKKKVAMLRAPHQATPDLDNLLKALADTIYEDDKIIWDVWATKVWAYEGFIVIKWALDGRPHPTLQALGGVT